MIASVAALQVEMIRRDRSYVESKARWFLRTIEYSIHVWISSSSTLRKESGSFFVTVLLVGLINFQIILQKIIVVSDTQHLRFEQFLSLFNSPIHRVKNDVLHR